MDDWPCGHPRTEENTYSSRKVKGRCPTCKRRLSRQHEAKVYRKRYLPEAIANTERKLAHLHKEAERLGVAL